MHNLPSRILPCLWLVLIAFPVPILSQSIPIQAENDTIRVLLFENHLINEIAIGAFRAPITISTGQKFIELSADKALVSITSKPGNPARTTVRVRNKRYNARSITIQSSGKGLIQLKNSQTGYRYYSGVLSIRTEKKGRGLHIINHTPLEAYIGGVIGGEMDFKHPTALKVQAVISRTYALWNMQSFREQPYDLTDHTSNQVFPGVLIQKPRFAEAARTTHAEVITWSNKLILAAFSSTCGGYTSNNEDVWDGNALPYLRSVNDHDACSESPHFRWSFKLDKRKLINNIQQSYGISPQTIRIDSTNSQGRVIRLKLGHQKQDSFETVKLLNSNEFRLLINRSFGIRSLRSSWFEISEKRDSLLFKGKGMGHGVGLCQWGALGLAHTGWNYRQILKFYYKGVNVVDYHSLNKPLRSLPLAQ